MVDSNNKVVLPIASEFKKPRFLKAVKQDEVPDAFEYILQAVSTKYTYTNSLYYQYLSLSVFDLLVAVLGSL